MKKTLWLLIASADSRGIYALAPTLSWLAEEAGIAFEMYLESHRDGHLFAKHGSTVSGGRHFQQFNYLQAAFDVQIIILGESSLFMSSINLFKNTILAQSDTVCGIYEQLALPDNYPVCIVSDENPENAVDSAPYMYPAILFSKAVGIPLSEARNFPREPSLAAGFSSRQEQTLIEQYPGLSTACTVHSEQGYVPLMRSIASEWESSARGVAFGDPDAIRSMLASLCREKRIALYAPVDRLPVEEIQNAAYVEEHSPLCDDVCKMAINAGNRVIVGRQTCDGDLFAWSLDGVCIRIMDPNRPAFPIVDTVHHKWSNQRHTVYDLEPEDATLEEWADEGRLLNTLLVHSGEMAHNEAMINLIELCSITGLKMGIGVHAARYRTCPQLWELISIPQDKGGALGLIEPVLHCGGMGVLAESNCPPDLLQEHAEQALELIAEYSGPAWQPKGHLCFMDSDMTTFSQTRPDIYAALSRAGLDYTVSCALPGRNRIIHATDNHIVLNQSNRTICTGSPYVRINTVNDLASKTPSTCPGWMIAVIDAPVVAFNPHIWQDGSAFMCIVGWLTGNNTINTTPNVISRYARILRERGLVPGLPENNGYPEN